jgi:hypothetical protein
MKTFFLLTCRGFQRPPETWPVVLPPYSIEPQPPVGHSSLNIQMVVPYTFEARHDSIVVLWFKACPSMLWYSCRASNIGITHRTHPHQSIDTR